MLLAILELFIVILLDDTKSDCLGDEGHCPCGLLKGFLLGFSCKCEVSSRKLFKLDVRNLGKDKEVDDIKEAIFAGKRIASEDEVSTDDTGKGIVGSDTAGEQLLTCILEVSVMLLGHIFDVKVTGEISSPEGCNGISEIEMVLFVVDFDVTIEGVICNDLLLTSDKLELTKPTAFKTF